MFGVGPLEIAVILVVAIVVFGPDRLPEFARQAARLLHQVRNFAAKAQEELREELGPEYADLRLRDLDPRAAVRKHIQEAMDDLDDEARAREIPPGVLPLTVGERPPYDDEAT